MKDENGFVEASRKGLARAANITPEQFEEGIKCLESPDPDSKNPANEGRRIAKIDGGWFVLNHEEYRLHSNVVREQTRERVRRHREKLKNYTEDFETFWKEYPRRVGKGKAFVRWQTAIKYATPEEITAGAKRYAEECEEKGTEEKYIKHPEGWLTARRWEDEPTEPKAPRTAL
jgi:hypothetical protein